MKQKVHVAGLNQRGDIPRFITRTESNNDINSASRPGRQVWAEAPSDISGVRSSTFQTPRRQYEQYPDSVSDSSRGNLQDRYRVNRFNRNREKKFGEILLQADGYHTEGTHNIIAAAKANEDENRRNHFVKPKRIYVHVPCPKRIFYAICLFVFGIIVPVTIVKVFEVNESPGRLSALHSSRFIEALGGAARYSEAQALWRNHVVIGDANRLLIPETFESRLNAEVAPLLEQHVTKAWDRQRYPELVCQAGEHLIVAFSLVKSASLPAGISYERPCTPHPNSKKCLHEKRVSDVRDLVVILPSKSSRYTFSVKVAEDRAGSSDKSEVPLPRRFQPLGTIRGPFQVELSDGSKLAVQRYCGTHRNNFAEDLDIEKVTKDNTRLLTIYELKRLYALWAKQRERVTGKRQYNWDTLQLSKATIDPIEHSRHSLSAMDLRKSFSSPIGFLMDTRELLSSSSQRRSDQAHTEASDQRDPIRANAAIDRNEDSNNRHHEDRSTEPDSASKSRDSTRDLSMPSQQAVTTDYESYSGREAAKADHKDGEISLSSAQATMTDGENYSARDAGKPYHEDEEIAPEDDHVSNIDDPTTSEMYGPDHMRTSETPQEVPRGGSIDAVVSTPVENKITEGKSVDGQTHSALRTASQPVMTSLHQDDAMTTTTTAIHNRHASSETKIANQEGLSTPLHQNGVMSTTGTTIANSVAPDLRSVPIAVPIITSGANPHEPLQQGPTQHSEHPPYPYSTASQMNAIESHEKGTRNDIVAGSSGILLSGAADPIVLQRARHESAPHTNSPQSSRVNGQQFESARRSQKVHTEHDNVHQLLPPSSSTAVQTLPQTPVTSTMLAQGRELSRYQRGLNNQNQKERAPVRNNLIQQANLKPPGYPSQEQTPTKGQLKGQFLFPQGNGNTVRYGAPNHVYDQSRQSVMNQNSQRSAAGTNGRLPSHHLMNRQR